MDSGSHRESAQLCSDPAHKGAAPGCHCEGRDRRCGGLKLFLAAMCFIFFAKALTGSYLKSTLTQLERRFDIPTALVGAIDGSFEMGNLLVIAPVSYFGAKLHRPKLIGIGCLLMAAGTFLIALPHLLMGRYEYQKPPDLPPNSSLTTSLCLRDPRGQNASTEKPDPEPVCGRDSGGSWWVCLLLGNLLRGLGESPVQPLGISYIDDHAQEENSAFYIGCIQTAAVIGPIFGFLLGSLCASLFVDVGRVDIDSLGISPGDGGWVGAWWLGYLVAGVVSLIAAMPFWFMPKGQSHPDLRKNSSTPSEQSNFILEDLRAPRRSEPEERGLLQMSRDLLPALRDLLANPLFLFFVCGSIFQNNALVGMVTYKPKYIEQQYGQTSARTNFIIGLINIPAVALGIFSGGIVMKRFHLTILGAARIILLSSLIGYLMLMSLFGLGCERLAVAGLTVSYDGISPLSSNHSPDSECNRHCLCVSHWNPVCGDNGLTYPSPCHAGCRSSNGSRRTQVYDGCSCVAESGAGSGSAGAGPCSRGRSCSRRFLYFVVISVVTSFTLSVGGTPGYFLLLRSVRPEMKSFALGIYTLAVRVLAGVPAPIYLGALIDGVCLQWMGGACGGRGSCRLYNTDRFRFIYLGVTVSLGLVFVFFSSLLLFILRKRHPAGERCASCAE